MTWSSPSTSSFGGNSVRFTSGSGSWTVPAGVTKILVLCIGGGGGNSACQAGGSNQYLVSPTASAGGFI